VAARHVILVDDILTTGATVSACARALEAGGPRLIGVVAVARVV
jgi:predicted amidophosphoribosyltransferase